MEYIMMCVNPRAVWVPTFSGGRMHQEPEDWSKKMVVCRDCGGSGTKKMEHIATCFQSDIRPCPSSNDGQHRWSGWPGAYCQDCFDEDSDELCVGNVCACPCHDEFWAGYAAYEEYQGSDQEYADDWERECGIWSEPQRRDWAAEFFAAWWWPTVPLAMLVAAMVAAILWPA